MESDFGTSEGQSSLQSAVHSDPLIVPIVEAFTLTKEDIDVLREYVDEFQEGNADCRTSIIANAMADIAIIRPLGETINKLDASRVRLDFIFYHLICSYAIAENLEMVL